MTSFTFRAGSGVAGDVTRNAGVIIESGILNPLQAPTAFGAPVKLVSGKFEKIAASDAASVFRGVLNRSVPCRSGDTGQAYASGSPDATKAQGILVQGYVNVVCTIGTPVRGGVVYMRVVAASGKAVGDFEATADGGNNVALTGVTWALDGKDAANVAEIRIA